MMTELCKKVPVVVLNGFLGSGKTTLLRSLLSQAKKNDVEVCVVVNDMSELDVDGDLISETALVEEGHQNFSSIHDCLLSSKKGIKKLSQALDQMRAVNHPDLILIETSGGNHPMPLIQYLEKQSELTLTGVLTLVDGLTLFRDFSGGHELLTQFQDNLENNFRDTTTLMVEQILFCSHLLLTKADRLEDSNIKEMAGSLHQINPYVPVMSVPWGQLSLEDIIALPPYDHQSVKTLTKELAPILEKTEDEERPYNMVSKVIQDDRPFHPQRLWDCCQQYLGQQVHRSKGFFWLASRDKVSLLWNQVGGSINLEMMGYWRSGLLDDENYHLSLEERQALEEHLSKAPGRFGDRECNLTIIGDQTQVECFEKSIIDCFLTEEEIQAWRRGMEFPDPWPKKIAKLSI